MHSPVTGIIWTKNWIFITIFGSWTEIRIGVRLIRSYINSLSTNTSVLWYFFINISSDLFLIELLLSQDTVEFYLLFFVIYALLVPVQVYAVTHQNHPVTKLFTGSLLLEFFGICLNLLNLLKYALDGVGFPRIAVSGDVLDILSRVWIKLAPFWLQWCHEMCYFFCLFFF